MELLIEVIWKSCIGGIRYFWKSVVCSVVIKEQICLTCLTQKCYSLLFYLMYCILTSVSLPFLIFFPTALFQRSSYSRLLMTFVYIENLKDFLVSISNFPKGCLCAVSEIWPYSKVFSLLGTCWTVIRSLSTTHVW